METEKSNVGLHGLGPAHAEPCFAITHFPDCATSKGIRCCRTQPHRVGPGFSVPAAGICTCSHIQVPIHLLNPTNLSHLLSFSQFLHTHTHTHTRHISQSALINSFAIISDFILVLAGRFLKLTSDFLSRSLPVFENLTKTRASLAFCIYIYRNYLFKTKLQLEVQMKYRVVPKYWFHCGTDYRETAWKRNPRSCSRNGTDAQKNSVCRAGKPEKLQAAGNRKLVGTCIYKLQRASEREAGAELFPRLKAPS